MAHCCVIGGAGFIGGHLLAALLASGRQVTVVGRSPRTSRCLPSNVRYCAGDYGDVQFCRAVLEDVDEVVDLAYGTVPKTSFDDPVQDILANLPPVVRFFQLASSFPLRKIVVVSSGGTVYGKARTLPITEDHGTAPISPYGITKLAIETYGRMFHHLHGLPVVIVRPANAFGPGQRSFGGQGFVAAAIAAIYRGEPVHVYGSTGTVRDYIYVTDVAAGIVAALDHGEPGACYNIGTGQGRSNLEVIETIGCSVQRLGLRPRIVFLPPRQFDVPANILDSTRLSRVSGWNAEIPFEYGIEMSLRGAHTWKEVA